MHKINSKEIARVDNCHTGKVFIDVLKLCLNTARYKVKVRGRKPNKAMMWAEGLDKYHYKRDGDIPRKHATELAIYLTGITHKCDACDVIKENKELRMRLAKTRTQLDKANAAIAKFNEDEEDQSDKLQSTSNTIITKLREKAGQQAATIHYLGRVIENLKDRVETTKTRAELWCSKWNEATDKIVGMEHSVERLNERIARDSNRTKTLKGMLGKSLARETQWARVREASKAMEQRQKCFLAMMFYFRD